MYISVLKQPIVNHICDFIAQEGNKCYYFSQIVYKDTNGIYIEYNNKKWYENEWNVMYK